MKKLYAVYEDKRVGTLYAHKNGLEYEFSFEYEPSWQRSAQAFPLSLSLPLTQEKHEGPAVNAYLWGQLPIEAQTIQAWTQGQAASMKGQPKEGAPATPTALTPLNVLAQMGEECTGAIQWMREDQLEPYLKQLEKIEQHWQSPKTTDEEKDATKEAAATAEQNQATAGGQSKPQRASLRSSHSSTSLPLETPDVMLWLSVQELALCLKALREDRRVLYANAPAQVPLSVAFPPSSLTGQQSSDAKGAQKEPLPTLESLQNAPSLIDSQAKAAFYHLPEDDQWGIPHTSSLPYAASASAKQAPPFTAISTPITAPITTHWLKTSSGFYADDIINEHFCATLGSFLKLNVVETTPQQFHDEMGMSAHRTDRAFIRQQWWRTHQENFGQAFGYYAQPATLSQVAPVDGQSGEPTKTKSAKKQTTSAAPTPQAMAQLLREHSSLPDADVTMLYRSLIYNWLIGRADAKPQHYHLLLGVGQEVRLAPLSRVTSLYPFIDDLRSMQMAMPIGQHQQWHEISVQDWINLALEFDLTQQEAFTHLYSIAASIPLFAVRTYILILAQVLRIVPIDDQTAIHLFKKIEQISETMNQIMRTSTSLYEEYWNTDAINQLIDQNSSAIEMTLDIQPLLSSFNLSAMGQGSLEKILEKINIASQLVLKQIQLYLEEGGLQED